MEAHDAFNLTLDSTSSHIMPIYAILGATGGTGSAIPGCLLYSQIPELRINILARSKSKLFQAFRN